MALAAKAYMLTVNDYLARRDAETNRPLFEFLGMTVKVNIPAYRLKQNVKLMRLILHTRQTAN